MRVLVIETSCDETAVSVLECSGDTLNAEFRVLGNALYSQAHLHAEYGGVFPTLAKREHIKNLPALLATAFREAASATASIYDSRKQNPLGIDLVAVTSGPGLEPALWTGIEFAKAEAARLGVPLVGADHMEGHIISALVTKSGDTTYKLTLPDFPILALLISGGHTELILMREWFSYELIGRTKDDAVGEAFDKVARLLDFPYPGGPKVAEAAARARARGTAHGIVFPRPLIHEQSCDFSFSGLKTAVRYKLRDMHDLSDETKEHVAEAFEDAARDALIAKTRRALHETNALTLAVGGGVSANTEVRRALQDLGTKEFPDVHIAFPHPSLTGDNALMIGMAAYLRHTTEKDGHPLEANGSRSLA